MILAARVRFFAPALVLTACAATPAAPGAAAQAGPPVATVSVSPAEVEPGGIAVVRLDDPRVSPASVVGHFRGARLAFFAGMDGRARALVGVDLATPSGTYPLTVEHRAAIEVQADGSDPVASGAGTRDRPAASASSAGTVLLTVRAKEFPREDLAVDRQYVDPDPQALARTRREQARLDAVLARVSPERLCGGAFQIPVEGPLGSPFGLRRFFNGQERSPHTGQDVRVPEGTPVAAAARGRVVLAAPFFFSGNTIVLDHGLGLYTLYFHLAAFRVREGAVVERGAVVGTSGKTGRVTGAHLHWAARVNGARVDPMFLTRGPVAEESDGTEVRH